MTETTHMRREVVEIPDAAARLLDKGEQMLVDAGKGIRERNPRFIVSVARGSSDHAASFLKYAIELTAGIPVASVTKMEQAMDAAKKKTEFRVYPDAPHGFHADYRPTYRKEIVDDAWKLAVNWFKKNKVLA